MARDRRRRRAWVVACILLVTGLAVSAAGALVWRAGAQARERQVFRSTADDVTATLDALLQRNLDFVGSLRAVLAMSPRLSPSGFDRWFAQLDGARRQIGSLGTTVVAAVPAARLAGFVARRNADPAFRVLVKGQVTPAPAPARGRPSCLLAAGIAPDGLAVTMAQVQTDWCDPRSIVGRGEAPLLAAARDSGKLVVYPVAIGGSPTALAEVAIYRVGAPLATVPERRAALTGWLIDSLDISAIVNTAVGRHAIALSLYHENPRLAPQLVEALRHGAPSKAYAVGEPLAAEGGPWTATIRGSVPAGLTATAQGLLVFGAGALITLLLSALVLVLTRSRERALGMVAETTGQLHHQSLHDALTGLPNRVLALDRTEHLIVRARRNRTPIAALHIDIDGFKQLNDTFGHAVGDELLRVVASRLVSVIRESDTAARLGADEFAVLLEGASLDGGPEMVADRILEVLREPYELGGAAGRTLSLTATIGIVSGLRANAEEMLRDADVALYEAKAAGKDRYVVFEQRMQTAVHARVNLEQDLAGALGRGELFLLYQPVFDLATERMTGVEALLRWAHPVRGVVAPEEFVPIAEDAGLIVPIGRWVIEQACRQTAAWDVSGGEIAVAVNVSARQLDDDTLIDDVRRALARSGLDARRLTLEVTETALMRDAEATAERLRQLKALGVRIAIDDFGTGYSSLAYLRQFAVDAIKIDRTFVRAVATSSESAALVQILVRLGKQLHLETLAEGIEDRAQLRALQRQRCDCGQGYLFAAPLDADEITQRIEGGQRAAAMPSRRLVAAGRASS